MLNAVAYPSEYCSRLEYVHLLAVCRQRSNVADLEEYLEEIIQHTTQLNWMVLYDKSR